MMGRPARPRAHGAQPRAGSRRARLRRGIGGALASTLLLGALAVPAPTLTEAAWTDAEAATGSFAAITVPAAEGVTCSYNPGVLGLLLASITMKWKPPAGYTKDSAEAGYKNSGDVLDPLVGNLLATVSSTESGGVVTTTATAILGLNIFSNKRVLAVRMKHSSGWTSAWLVGTVEGSACTFSVVQ